MSFRAFITELFDAAEPYKPRKSSSDPNFEYEFEFEGNQFRVYIDHQPEANGDLNGDVTFVSSQTTSDFKMKATGDHAGSSHRVFSTVIKIMKDHAKKYKGKGLKSFTFAADVKEPSRVMLYKKFSSMMGGKAFPRKPGDEHYKFRIPVPK